MQSKPYSPQEMEEKCIVRFNKLKYMGAGEKRKEGPIPPEVYKMLAAPAFAITAPEFDNGPWGEARVKVPDYVNIIAELPPGGGVPLHMHAKTIETFMALTGRWKLQWGDQGEHETILEQFDTFAVPAAVSRRFENVGTEKAYLLVLISGGTHDMNDLMYAPSVGADIEAKFGKGVREHVEKVGFQFNAGIVGEHAKMT
ncbi:MAG: cupin domain-containing protein [Burkholderiales bacterium]